MVRLVRRDLAAQYRGRWVAIDAEDDVVAHAQELGPLLERLAYLDLTADFVQRMPEIDQPIVIGLR